MEYNLSAHDVLPLTSHAITRLLGEAAREFQKNDENSILITQHNIPRQAHRPSRLFQHHLLLILNRDPQNGRAT